jgi:butyryl-CoA dehydrogenase
VDFSPSPEAVQFQRTVRKFGEELLLPRARGADEAGRFDRSLIPELGRQGLLDERRPAVDRALASEELGRVDSSVRGFVTVQVSLVAQCIADWGTREQKDEWLPQLRTGEAIGCYALTEPDAGSDTKSMKVRAERTNDGWRLSGIKHWITNGGVADVAIVFAAENAGLTAFLVPTTIRGLNQEVMPGQLLGHRASDHGRLVMESVPLPRSAVIGELGHGSAVAMRALRHGRLGVAAGAVGIMQGCLEASVDFARKRWQFGRRIGDFEMIQAAIADIAADLEAGQLLVMYAAWLSDTNSDNGLSVAAAKLFCTEAALRAADQAILIHGARGYSNQYPVERYWRDAKGMQIYEGTSHIQRIILARHLLGRPET